ncbi:MAG: HXXEE domain-containing protein, partial [Gammaproteobacteria bacterium]
MTASRSVMLWATPLAFVVHNAEEAWTFPRYVPRVQAHLPEALRTAAIPIVGIEMALIAVTAAFLAMAAWATMRPHSALATWGALLVPALGALNALTHVGSAVFVLHGYSPGVLTAVCLVAPISGLVLR